MAQENRSGLVKKINQHLLCAQLNMRNQLNLKTLLLSNQRAENNSSVHPKKTTNSIQ